MNKKTIATMIFLLIFLSACIIRTPPHVVPRDWVVKQLTQCGDEITPEMSEPEIVRYYMERGITIYDVFKEEVLAVDCDDLNESCGCLSNVIIHLLVSEDDMMYFLEQGYDGEGITVERPPVVE